MIECKLINKIDILLAIIGLAILAPILIPLIIILKYTGEGEVFYLQERIGKEGKKFKIYKFATMLKNSPSLGNGHITVRNDPRVLKVGRILRKTKFNELPQLYNVLRGEMSMVGPRPLTQDHFELYASDVKDTIMTVKPGITGVGSLAFRDEESVLSQATNPREIYQELIAPKKAKLEIWYINNRSIFLYIKIIFLTIITLFFKKNRFLVKFLNSISANS